MTVAVRRSLRHTGRLVAQGISAPAPRARIELFHLNKEQAR